MLVGPRRLSYRLFPPGNGMGIVFRDITDLRSAEEHRELLIDELKPPGQEHAGHGAGDRRSDFQGRRRAGTP